MKDFDMRALLKVAGSYSPVAVLLTTVAAAQTGEFTATAPERSFTEAMLSRMNGRDCETQHPRAVSVLFSGRKSRRMETQEATKRCTN